MAAGKAGAEFTTVTEELIVHVEYFSVYYVNGDFDKSSLPIPSLLG